MATIYTQADLDKIDGYINAAALVESLTLGNRTYNFRDIDDMLKVRAFIAGQLAAVATPSSGYRVAATSKGV